MAPEGISVVEINLCLPNSQYYLYWKPDTKLIEPDCRRALLEDIRLTAGRLDWRIFAAGTDSEAARLFFATTNDSLQAGMSTLLHDADCYHLYLAQPEGAGPAIARYVRENSLPLGWRHAPPRANTATELPRVHHGLFMGQRAWADRMLDRLIRPAAGTPPRPSGALSLPAIARRHTDTREAILVAYLSGGFTLKHIAEHFGMHFSEVSAVINSATSLERHR